MGYGGRSCKVASMVMCKIYTEYVQRNQTKVQIGHDVSEYFMCKVGSRQGEHLSPFLFSIYINDFEDYLLRNGVNGFN